MPGPANRNRAERRALTRHNVKGLPMVRIMDLTLDEAEIVAEALDAYVLTTAEVADPPTPVQAWAMDRASQIRDLVQAALDNRPWHDSGTSRQSPEAQENTCESCGAFVSHCDCFREWE